MNKAKRDVNGHFIYFKSLLYKRRILLGFIRVCGLQGVSIGLTNLDGTQASQGPYFDYDYRYFPKID